MTRSALAAALLIALALPVASPAAGNGSGGSDHFAIVASGGTVVDGGATRLLLDLEDRPKASYKFGSGAASLFVFRQADSSQKASGHAYYGPTRLRLRITYTIAAPDADNVSAISGRATLRGTLRGHGVYLVKLGVTGSQDGSGLLKLRMTGTVYYPVWAGSGRGH